MKKLGYFSVWALVMVLFLGTGLAEAQDVIRIGSIYPLTGAIASSGLRSKHAVETAIDVINNKYDFDIPFARTQGIPNLKGAKLQVIWGDSQASPEVGKTEAERLITQEKVPLLLGAYQSSVSKAASFVAERFKIPFVCAESSSAELTERGLKYFFRIAPTDAEDSIAFFDFLDQMKAKGKKVERVAIVYENTEFGVHARGEAKKQADKRGYKIVADVPYTFKSTDVKSEVLKVKAAKPDVIIQASLLGDMMLFAKTFKEQKVEFGESRLLRRVSRPHLCPEYEKDAEFYMGQCTFSPDFIAKKPVLAKINDMYKKRSGVDFDGVTIEGFTSVLVIADAFNRAQSTDPEKVVQALRTTDLKTPTLPGEGVKFNENGQNIKIISHISQVQKGQYRVVWPGEMAATEMVWPFTPWDKR
ncbi:MAG: amino acid ABC transporter substrate-binding protein [Deltaproteobacteria bacterium]|nr:MAG: amino acid ABC transporter substrate-binding protein [Deltaproteobacteria bacterium]